MTTQTLVLTSPPIKWRHQAERVTDFMTGPMVEVTSDARGFHGLRAQAPGAAGPGA